MSKKMSIEAAFRRLDEIVALLEDEKLPLDASVKAFEEGVSLIHLCNEQLNGAKLKIEKLTGALTPEENESDEQQKAGN